MDVNGWQPIETAPKDGTIIDLWMTDESGNGWRVPDAWYVYDYSFSFSEYQADGTHCQKRLKRDGWYAEHQDYEDAPGWCDFPKIFNHHPKVKKEIWMLPTHWMPLPPPPVTV